MAYSYRASTSAGGTSGGAVVVNKPTGTADGDLIVVTAYLEDNTNTWSGVPSGWNTGPSIANPSIFKIWTFWKIAASEPSSWTWTPASNNWRYMACSSYSGALGTGTTRVDVSGTNQGDGAVETAQTAPTVTTTADGDLVVDHYGNYNGTTVTSTVGFATNLRVNLNGTIIADAIKTTAGATGTTYVVGPGTQDFAALHVAYFLDTGGAATKAPPPFRKPYRFLRRR